MSVEAAIATHQFLHIKKGVRLGGFMEGDAERGGLQVPGCEGSSPLVTSSRKPRFQVVGAAGRDDRRNLTHCPHSF